MLTVSAAGLQAQMSIRRTPFSTGGAEGKADIKHHQASTIIILYACISLVLNRETSLSLRWSAKHVKGSSKKDYPPVYCGRNRMVRYDYG